MACSTCSTCSRLFGLPACVPGTHTPGAQLAHRLRARWLVAGGWWLVACVLKSRGREGLGLDVSATAASENNFSKFFISAS